MSGWSEVLRSTDLVRLSWAEATLKAAGVPTLIYDAGVSAVEGGVSAFPRRLMAPSAEVDRAIRLLAAVDPDVADDG